MLSGAEGFAWGLIPCVIQSGWKQTNQFGTTSKGEIVFSWCFQDIKISKSPNVSFPKMVGFCNFLWFWHLSQRNYNWQSYWITLYVHISDLSESMQCAVFFTFTSSLKHKSPLHSLATLSEFSLGHVQWNVSRIELILSCLQFIPII